MGRARRSRQAFAGRSGTGLLTKTIDVALPSLSGEVTVGGGSVWTVNGESTLARVAPVSPRVLEQGLAGQRPTAIAYAAGSLWGRQRRRPERVPVQPHHVLRRGCRDADLGRRWAHRPRVRRRGDLGREQRRRQRDADRCDLVRRLDDPDVEDGPVAIAFGADAVWDASGDGTVSRIDPGTRRAVKTITVGNVPPGSSSRKVLSG